MTLGEFAERQRLRIRRDEDGSYHIPGRAGQLFEYDGQRLAVMYLDGTPRAWGNRKRACLAVGMELHQDGDAEGTLLFDPENDAQAELGIQVAGVGRRRVLSDEHRRSLVAAGAAHRFVSDGDGCSEALHALETSPSATAG